MIEKKIGKIIITYDPFSPQFVNNHLYNNTGIVILNKGLNQLELHNEIQLSGGDLLGYRIFHSFKKICVYARGTNKCYLIDKNKLNLVKEVNVDFIPKSIYFKNNSYYILTHNSNNFVKIEYNEDRDLYYYIYVYRFFLMASIIFPFIFLCMYFLK